jgi:hypothetical protein
MSNNGDGRLSKSIGSQRGLTPRQERIALLMASGASVVAASRRAGVAEPTVRMWLATLPHFKDRIREIRSDMTARVTGYISRCMLEAARTLRKLLRHKSAVMRRNAANDLLTHGHNLNSVEALMAEIEALKRGR